MGSQLEVQTPQYGVPGSYFAIVTYEVPIPSLDSQIRVFYSYFEFSPMGSLFWRSDVPIWGPYLKFAFLFTGSLLLFGLSPMGPLFWSLDVPGSVLKY